MTSSFNNSSSMSSERKTSSEGRNSAEKFNDEFFQDRENSPTRNEVRNRRRRQSRSALDSKISEMRNGLLSEDLRILKSCAISEGGLIDDRHRRRVWPRLMGIRMIESPSYPSEDEISTHKDYNQVVMDVNRSLKRFPPCITDEQRPELQEQLTRLIIRVLMKHPHLHYYQGYHDVAITFLLVVGEDLGFRMLEELSLSHFNSFMTPTMEKTSYNLQFIYPIIKREDPELFNFLEDSELGTIFALPWVITWFSHVLSDYDDVVRLYDYFIVQPSMMPVYFAAALVIHRSSEILRNCEREMASVHALLSKIPTSLPFEDLLKFSLSLYERYPLDCLCSEVEERVRKENENIESRLRFAAISRRNHDLTSYSLFFAKAMVVSTPVVLGVAFYKLYKEF